MKGFPRLVLASRSPRRRELLERAGFRFTVRPSGVVEAPAAGERPVDYVIRLAREKAEAVAVRKGEVVLGADTVVVAAGRLLEKPADAADAARMLELLAGREHEVITGLCLRHPGGSLTDSARTRVRFLPLTPAEISDYVATGEPMDKAGGYAIQGKGSRFVERIEGSYSNVVGLPVALVYEHLRRIVQAR